MQTSKTAVFNHSQLLQFILNQSLHLAGELQKGNNENLSERLLGKNIPFYLDWSSSFSGNISAGIIRKMQLYYAQLMHSCEDLPPLEYRKIGEALQQLIVSAMTTPCETKHIENNVTLLVHHLLEGCKCLGKDPALFLFLWCKHKKIDALLEKGRILVFFHYHFSEQLDQAHDYLSTTYAKKGYTHLLPIIKKNFMALRLCCVQI